MRLRPELLLQAGDPEYDEKMIARCRDDGGLRFRTAGTTQYVIKDIVESETVIGLRTAHCARISDHAIGDVMGHGFENKSEFYEIIFTAMPRVGHSFGYDHPIWGGSLSSTVMEFFDADSS